MKKRILSAFLAVVMIVLSFPLSAIPIAAVSSSGLTYIDSDNPDDYGWLGMTFNALDPDPDKRDKISVSNLQASSIFDTGKLSAYVLGDGEKGVMEQYSIVEYANSAEEMMRKFGISSTSSQKASVGIKKIKAGFETKFSHSVDYTHTSKSEEIFYYFCYRAVCEQYRIKTTSDYSKMLSSDFLADVDALSNQITPEKIASFFDLYGTHVLIQYDKGGQMTFTASAINTSTEDSLNDNVSTEINTSAGVESEKINANVEAAQSVETAFSLLTNNSNMQSGSNWETIGGSSIYCNQFSGKNISFDESSLEAWVSSISGSENSNSTLIPETSQWVAIWEVLNDVKHAAVKQALYNYYIEQSAASNSEFFAKFCKYTNMVSIPSYTYKNSRGYVYTLSESSMVNGALPVEAGSQITVPISFSNDKNYTVDYDISDGASVDKNGVVSIDENAYEGTEITLDFYINGVKSYNVKFTVKKEGAPYTETEFDGGYGTSERPYIISSFAQLENMKYYTTRSFMLANDINGNDAQWTPFAFSGTFDGAGYTISNLKIDSTAWSVGFFSYVNGSNNEIKNLNLDNISITSSRETSGTSTAFIGFIVGYLDSESIIQNCSIRNSSATINHTYNSTANNDTFEIGLGGITGYNSGRITNCHSEKNNLSISLTGKCRSDSSEESHACVLDIGGISGKTYEGTVKECSSYDNTLFGHTYTYGMYRKTPKIFKMFSMYFYIGGVIGNVQGGTVSGNRYYNNGLTLHKEYSTGSSLFSYADYNKTIYGTTDKLIGKIHDADYTLTENLEDPNRSPKVKQITGVHVTQNSNNKHFVDQMFDYSTLSVKGVYDDNSLKNSFNMYHITEFNSSKPGNKIVTVTYPYCYKNEQQAIIPITHNISIEILPLDVKELTVTSHPSQSEYFIGDEEFNITGMEITAVLADGSMNVISNYDIIGFDTSVPAESLPISISYGGKTVDINISVSEVQAFKLQILTMPTKTNYAVGDPLDLTGLSVKVFYNNGTVSAPISEGIKASGFVPQVSGHQTVSLEYEGVSSEMKVNVGKVSAIEIVEKPAKENYYVGDKKVDTTGLLLRVIYENGIVREISEGFDSVSDLSAVSKGTETVTVAYAGKTANFNVYVNDVEISSIEAEKTGLTNYYIGDKISLDGLVVKATYNNGTSKDIPHENCTVLINGNSANSYVFNSTGAHTVSIEYVENDKRVSTEYQISVFAIEMEKIEITKTPDKTNYKINEPLVTDGLRVIAIYNNGEIIDITERIDNFYYNFSVSGSNKVTIYYNGLSAEYNVNVIAPQSIEVKTMPHKTEYHYGESFDSTGLQIVAKYSDNSYVYINDFTIIAPETMIEESCLITIAYCDLYTSFNVRTLMPQININSGNATIGSTLSVTIQMKNNPGIASAKLNVSFDTSVFTLTDIIFNEEIGGRFQHPQNYDNSVILNWINPTENTHGDFTFATLVFDVKETALTDTKIVVSYNPEDVYNIDENNIPFSVNGGDFKILEYTPGDMNGDYVVNNKDLTRLFQYLSGWDVNVNDKALDTNRDGVINNKDLTRLFQYMSGWDVEIA